MGGASFETGAEHGGGRGVNEGHVDPLRAILWTDDLGEAFGPRLAQQLTWEGVWVGRPSLEALGTENMYRVVQTGPLLQQHVQLLHQWSDGLPGSPDVGQ